MSDEIEIDPELLDQLGQWSIVKHEIIEKYARAYTTIVTKQAFAKGVIYADAYAGCGFGEDRHTHARLRGSAVRLMEVTPPFTEVHLIEGNAEKAAVLRSVSASDPRVRVYTGDAIETLTTQVLPRCRYEDFKRAICLLDPYDLSVPWTVVEQIGRMKSVEIFYNFMIMDMNRNVLRHDQDQVTEAQRARMDVVWGDRSWQTLLYRPNPQINLFGGVATELKVSNDEVVAAFRKRLRQVAQFAHVPEPIAMRNRNGAAIYYLFFAGPNPKGAEIVEDVFSKYRR